MEEYFFIPDIDSYFALVLPAVVACHIPSEGLVRSLKEPRRARDANK